jgi:CoA:oxalate CoA-transferase
MPGHLALEGVRVLESARHLAGPFAGRLLAALGADVLKAEPPQGDSLRSIADGAIFSFLNAGKQSIVVENDDELLRLASSVDIWLDARPIEAIRRAQESLDTSIVYVAITPFGLTGPWAEREATSIVASAMGAFMHLCGDPSREPLRNGASLPDFQQGLFAAIGAVAALLAKEAGRPGVISVDVSLLESVIAYQERADMALLHQGRDWVRSRRHEVGHPFTIFECADGFVSLAVGTPRHWANLCVLMGKPEWGEDLDILMNRLAKADMIDEALVPWLRSKPAAEIVRECQEVFIPCGPVFSIDEVLEDAHLASRSFFTDMALPGGVSLRMPRSPLRAEWVDTSLPPAPTVGQHTTAWAGAAS